MFLKRFQSVLSLSVFLAFTAVAFAQQPAATGASSKQTPLSPKEFAARKERLIRSKNVAKWPPASKLGQPGQIVVDLSVTECTFLGGKVEYWSSCGATLMKGVGSNGNAMCIDTIK